MASEEESDAGEAGLEAPPAPNFPDGKRPSTGTDIGFDDSTSEAPTDDATSAAPTDDGPRGSTLQRASQRGSQGGEPGRGSMLKRGSKDEAGERRKSRNPKSRESTATEGKPPRRQWGSQRPSTSIEGVNLEMPEAKELLRRLKEAEESEGSSTSTSHAVSAKMASPKPGEHHRGIKVDSRNPFVLSIA